MNILRLLDTILPRLTQEETNERIGADIARTNARKRDNHDDAISAAGNHNFESHRELSWDNFHSLGEDCEQISLKSLSRISIRHHPAPGDYR